MGEDYIICKNELKYQDQMARIKIDGWRNAYDKIGDEYYEEFGFYFDLETVTGRK